MTKPLNSRIRRVKFNKNFTSIDTSISPCVEKEPLQDTSPKKNLPIPVQKPKMKFEGENKKSPLKSYNNLVTLDVSQPIKRRGRNYSVNPSQKLTRIGDYSLKEAKSVFTS